MFEHWDSFYLLIGGAAGALIGLLFVVVTLTANMDRDSALRGANTYMTPLVFHFAVVVALSAMAAAPGLGAGTQAGLIGVSAATGVIYALIVIVRMRRGLSATPVHWTDPLWYGAAPGVIYLSLGGSALAVASQAGGSPYAVAACLLALLLTTIRNAWDLVTWIAPQGGRK